MNNEPVASTAICMEEPLLIAARNRAKRRRQSFSAYVATLLERDLHSEAVEKPPIKAKAKKEEVLP